MQKNLVLFLVSFFIAVISFAQQLPLGTCGIVCTYDAAGNRLRRLYYCNNGGLYPTKVNPPTVQEGTTEEFIQVDALYPNPTTGRFVITFSKELKNAKVYITDMNGKVVQQTIGNGMKLNFDLFGLANGVYMVRIEDAGLIITKKVVKQ